MSVDTVPSKLAWAESLEIKNTPLLSDFWPHGEVAKLYGIFRDKNGFSERANILIDENQKIVFFKVSDALETLGHSHNHQKNTRRIKGGNWSEGRSIHLHCGRQGR